MEKIKVAMDHTNNNSNADSASGVKRKLDDQDKPASSQDQAMVPQVSSEMDNKSTTRSTRARTASTTSKSPDSTGAAEDVPEVNKHIQMEPIPDRQPRVIFPLSSTEVTTLENALQFEADDETWREDWAGNLAFVDKDVANPQVRSRDSFQQSLIKWARGNPVHVPLVYNVLRFVYHMNETPPAAKMILACADPNDFDSIQKAVRRTSYDPEALEQDGWTTRKSAEEIGATGGPFLIGDNVRWHGADAVVIAYTHDDDLGDLWKAVWLDDHYETFDLEADEVIDAKKKYTRRQRNSIPSKDFSRRSVRYQVSSDFSVKGIEDGIVLATTYCRNARPGVYWPARVMHASEATDPMVKGKRNASKQKVQLVFLAPYWDSDDHIQSARSRQVEPLSEVEQSVFSSGPLLLFDTVDAADEMIKEYPYYGEQGLDVGQLRTAFRFTGLPKAAFPRFLDSNRLAMGLKKYSRDHLKSEVSASALASAGLFDSHPMTIQAPIFPTVVLSLPFPYILSQLPRQDDDQNRGSSEDGDDALEPVLDLSSMVEAMKPPYCWGVEKEVEPSPSSPVVDKRKRDNRPRYQREPPPDFQSTIWPMLKQLGFFIAGSKYQFNHPAGDPVRFDRSEDMQQYLLDHGIPFNNAEQRNAELSDKSKELLEYWVRGSAPKSPDAAKAANHHSSATSPGFWLGSQQEVPSNEPAYKLDSFVHDMSGLKKVLASYSSFPPVAALLAGVPRLLFQLHETKDSSDATDRNEKLKSLIESWTLLKRQGEEAIASIPKHGSAVSEWKRVSERIYKFITFFFSSNGQGNGISAVLTDEKCNGHRTSNGCFERAVRLPAALKGAKLAGAGTSESIPLISSIPSHYYEFVEKDLLKKVHSTPYLKRMQSRCAAAQTDDDVLTLTDDSEGNGGEDTRGSRGTWAAAVSAVAAAITGVDMVVRGQAVNAFSVTRPPGHHAGRNLHAMKAISNGFCILNSAACAAIYATTPISEGGLGLSRVCVIDFDVHHGNGTQDILCSTYDPRFLYVSMHAGGAHVNGVLTEDDPNHELHDLGFSPKQSGIYPGRCGNTSPHKGVLNIPLGNQVTSHAVGSALISRVTPAVDAFEPDLIILSAGFDAHKADPMGLGGLWAEDFGHITEVACQLAFKSCSGRVLSILEGGYGVPCCRPQRQDIFLPPPPQATEQSNEAAANSSTAPDPAAPNGTSASAPTTQRPQPSQLLQLNGDLPSDMDDQVPYALQRRLEKCHAEGFVECVKEHVASLARRNTRKV